MERACGREGADRQGLQEEPILLIMELCLVVRGVRQGKEGERVWAAGEGQEAGVVVGGARGVGP